MVEEYPLKLLEAKHVQQDHKKHIVNTYRRSMTPSAGHEGLFGPQRTF